MGKNRFLDNKGFTLIELLVVITIIGLLSSLVFSFLNRAKEHARFSQVSSQLDYIYKAAFMYYSDSGYWPPDGYPGQSPTFVNANNYMPTWPVPPCSGWTYDWENWANRTIRITVRNSDEPNTSENSILYFCIYSDVSTCDSYGPGGGTNIKTVTDKRITCEE